MFVYSKDLYLIPFTGIVTLQARDVDSGYLYVSTDTYNSLVKNSDNLLTLVHCAPRCKENKEVMATWSKTIPDEIRGVLGLLQFIAFPAPEEFEQIAGILSVLLRTLPLDKMSADNEDEFKHLSYTDHILKEYALAWKQFFSECIPHDAMINPDSHYNKYMFFTLAPFTGAVGAMPMGGVMYPPPQPGYAPQSYSAPPPPPVSNDTPVEDLTWQQILAATERFQWFDGKTFLDGSTGNMISVDELPDDEVVRLKEMFSVETAGTADAGGDAHDAGDAFDFDDDDDDPFGGGGPLDTKPPSAPNPYKGDAPDVPEAELRGLQRILAASRVAEEKG